MRSLLPQSHLLPSFYDAPTVGHSTLLLSPGWGAALSGTAGHGHDGSGQSRKQYDVSEAHGILSLLTTR